MPDEKDENRKAVTAGISSTDGDAIRRMVEAGESSRRMRELNYHAKPAAEDKKVLSDIKEEKEGKEEEKVDAPPMVLSRQLTLLSLTTISRRKAVKGPSAPITFPNQVFDSSGGLKGLSLKGNQSARLAEGQKDGNNGS